MYNKLILARVKYDYRIYSSLGQVEKSMYVVCINTSFCGVSKNKDSSENNYLR